MRRSESWVKPNPSMATKDLDGARAFTVALVGTNSIEPGCAIRLDFAVHRKCGEPAVPRTCTKGTAGDVAEDEAKRIGPKEPFGHLPA